MAEEAKDPGHDVPKAVNLVLIAVLGVYAGISVVALSALPVVHHGVGYSAALGETFTTPATRRRWAASTKTTRCSGSSTSSACTAPTLTIARDYVGVLAATILFIATNAGPDRDLAAVVVAGRAPPAAGDLLPAAPPLPHAVVHDRLLLGRSPAC